LPGAILLGSLIDVYLHVKLAFTVNGDDCFTRGYPDTSDDASRCYAEGPGGQLCGLIAATRFL